MLRVVAGGSQPSVRSVPGQARTQTYGFGKREGKECRKSHDYSHDPQPVGSPNGEAAIRKGSIDVYRINHWVFRNRVSVREWSTAVPSYTPLYMPRMHHVLAKLRRGREVRHLDRRLAALR